VTDISDTQLYGQVDLSTTGLLPVGWVDSVMQTISRYAVRVELDGSYALRSEEEPVSKTKMQVVTGDVIASGMGWISSLYRGEILQLAEKFAAYPLACSEDQASAININVLERSGSIYERHTDQSALTAVLFASSSLGRGGELVLEHPNRGEIRIEPHEGSLVIFWGGEVAHSVSPLSEDWTRVSIPMNFYRAHETQEDRAKLNSYLYTPAQ